MVKSVNVACGVTSPKFTRLRERAKNEKEKKKQRRCLYQKGKKKRGRNNKSAVTACLTVGNR